MLQATTNELQFQEAQSTPHKSQSGLNRMSEAITYHVQFQETQGKPHKSQPGLPIMSKATNNELLFQEALSTPHRSQSRLHRMPETITTHAQFQETQDEPCKSQLGLSRVSQATDNETPDLQHKQHAACNIPHIAHLVTVTQSPQAIWEHTEHVAHTKQEAKNSMLWFISGSIAFSHKSSLSTLSSASMSGTKTKTNPSVRSKLKP